LNDFWGRKKKEEEAHTRPKHRKKEESQNWQKPERKQQCELEWA